MCYAKNAKQSAAVGLDYQQQPSSVPSLNYLDFSDSAIADIINFEKWNAPFLDVLESTCLFSDGFSSETSTNITDSQTDAFAAALNALDKSSEVSNFDFDKLSTNFSISSPQSTLCMTEANISDFSPINSPTSIETSNGFDMKMLFPEISNCQLQYTMPTFVQAAPTQDTQDVGDVTKPSPASNTNTTSSTTTSNNTVTSAKSQKKTAPRKATTTRTNKKRSFSDSDPEEDETVLKRKRNTEAARRSRQRKVEKMENLEHRVKELEGDNTTLGVRIAVLENEKVQWNVKECELLERIKRLEEQLVESHQALVGLGVRVDDLM
ncbi:hypothetical protein HK098_002441 [Nowakowskiella sp. JEL0407]|nr:hypothetical protein HK098_002441 [Nowakowskiella sp. JEL0407]